MPDMPSMFCSSPGCSAESTVFVTASAHSRGVEERYLCNEHVASFFSQFAGKAPDMEPSAIVARVPIGARTYRVEMVIYYRDETIHEISLREVAGCRRFVLTCGPVEAMAVAGALKGITGPRPTMHDVTIRVAESLNTEIFSLFIHSIMPSADCSVPGTYLADMIIGRAGDRFSIDLRPSDGISIALKAKAPIYVSDKVTDERRLPMLASRAVDSRKTDAELGNTATTFLVGHYRYRRAGRRIAVLVPGLVLGVALAGTVCTAVAPAVDMHIRAAAFALSLVVSAVFVSVLRFGWRSLTSSIATLELTADGVTSGSKHWTWAEIEMIRICPLARANNAACVAFRPVRRRWRCRYMVPFILDEPLSKEEREEIVARIRHRLEQLGCGKVCERRKDGIDLEWR